MAAEHHTPKPIVARGFTLVVIVVLLAIGAILSAVIFSTLSGDNDQARVERVAETLHKFASEMDSLRTAGSQSFKSQVTVYPGHLAHLYAQIGGSDVSCAGTCDPVP